MNTINRRDYLRTMAAGSAGIGLASLFGFPDAVRAGTAGADRLAGNLSAIAIVDDAAALAVQSGWVSAAMTDLIKSDFHIDIPANFSRMGFLIQTDDKQALAVLQNEKQNAESLWNGMNESDRQNNRSEPMLALDKSRKKMAMILGWFLAAGVREILMPIRESASKDDDMVIYQDMAVLKNLSGIRPNPESAQLSRLFRLMNPRYITRIHTLTPDYDHALAWTVRISDWHNDTFYMMQSYANAYAEQNSPEYQKYVSAINFYNENDGLIRLARQAQNGETITAEALKTGLSQINDSSSIYARAIALGVNAFKTTKLESIFNE